MNLIDLNEGDYEPLRRQLARKIAAALAEAVTADDLPAVAAAFPSEREVLAEVIRVLAGLVQYTNPSTEGEQR